MHYHELHEYNKVHNYAIFLFYTYIFPEWQWFHDSIMYVK